jgi:hypothetical protein
MLVETSLRGTLGAIVIMLMMLGLAIKGLSRIL